jgi:hypothetical protein
MKDIAAGGAWQSLGTIDNGARASTENLEFARGALAPNGRGIVTFRINNPAAGTSRDYVEQVDTGAATPIGAPQKLADVSTGGDAIPVVDANGNGLALYHHMVDGNPEPVVRDFVPNAPAQEIVLGSNVEVLPVGSFQADAAGDFVAFARTGTAPVHVHAIFGDFVPPTLEPKSDSATAVLGQQTTLHGGATDAFAQLGANAVTWQFPAGSIFGPTDLTGSDVDVRFATVGNVVVEVSATDAAGNTASASLTVRVIAHAKLHAVPASAHTGARMKLVGAGFAPAKAVSLVMGPPRANVTARFGAVRADARGNFSKSVFVSKKTRAGRYVLIACQLKCRVKATAAVRVR